MAVLYTNNAASSLSASITSTATSFSVATGQGALFPALSGSDYFYATLYDSSSNYEIVKVTARSTDTFTVTRGQDGTTARAYAAGDKIELRVVRALLDDFKTDTRTGYLPLSGGTMTAGLTFSGATGYNPISITGGVAGYYPAVQDGAGRVNWYWNKAGSGGSPTFEVGSEDALRLKFSTSQAAGTEAGIGVYYAPASSAGAAITWTEILGAFHNRFQYLGNTVLHAGNYTSYSPSLTGSGASGTWAISISGNATSAGSAGYATLSTIQDTRASLLLPNQYSGNRATYEFTNQIVGSDWHSAFTMVGWSSASYAAWQLVGGSSTSTHENLYFRSGVGSTWGSLRTILHSGNFTNYTGQYVLKAGDTMTGALYNGRYLSNYSVAPYYWNGSTLQYYWTKIANINNVGHTQMTIEISAKADSNFVPYTRSIASVATYNNSTQSLKLDALTSYDVPIKLAVDNSGDVWIYAQAEWSSYITWRFLDVLGSPTIYTSGWTQQLTQPANSVAIQPGQNVRGSQGAMSSATPGTSSANQFGSIYTLGAISAAGSIQQAGNQVLHAGNYSSYALPLGGGTLSGNLVLSSGYIDLGGHLYARQDYNVLNAAQNGWITVLARNGGAPYLNNVTYNGNVILHAGNYTSYVAGLGGGNYTGTVQVTQSGVVDAFKSTNSSTTLTDESSFRFQKTMTPTGTATTNYVGGIKWEAKNSNGSAYDMVRIYGTNLTSTSLDSGNYAIGELNLATYKYIGGYSESVRMRLSGGNIYWHFSGTERLRQDSTKIYPSTSGAYDLGDASFKFGTVYTNSITFGDGTTLTTAAAATYAISYLVVAGGGGGGNSGNSGGGGGGGVLAASANLTVGTTYSVTVGAGGAVNATGGSSAFGVFATANGGGAGGAANAAGSGGGSGGGGGYMTTAQSGGAGTSGQGYAGGASTAAYGGAGGGGGSAVGANGTSNGGNGGAGYVSSITGTTLSYAGGGGGGSNAGQGLGGAGGGGNGGPGTSTAGTANTGGGGGGFGNTTAGKGGGSGVVILQIPTAKYSGVTTGAPTVTTSGDYTILKFTASGSYTA